MSTQIKAIFENGVFRPLDAVELPDGEQVELTVRPANGSSEDPAANLLDIARDLGIPGSGDQHRPLPLWPAETKRLRR